MGAETSPLIRAVLDTNVLVSALLFRGAPSRLFVAWRAGAFRPLVSRSIVLEYARVLAYAKFRLPTERIRELLEGAILPYVETVEVRSCPRVVRDDPADDEILACAIAGRADYVVSGDRHLLALERHEEIPILRPAEFLDVLDRRPKAGG